MREILARFDGLSERVDAIGKDVDAIGKDAREARDATIGLNARMGAENTQEQLAKIWARIEAADTEHRSDLLNAIARSGERTGVLEARVVKIEEWKNRLEGANGLVGWLAKHAPWLATAAIAGLAIFKGVKT